MTKSNTIISIIIKIILIFIVLCIILSIWRFHYLMKNTKFFTFRDLMGFSLHGAVDIRTRFYIKYLEYSNIPINYSTDRNILISIYKELYKENKSIPIDPFRKGCIFYEGDGWRPNYKSGYFGDYFDYISDGNTYILIIGYGPNKVRDIDPQNIKGMKYMEVFDYILNYAYDPTNGMNSSGDTFYPKELIILGDKKSEIEYLKKELYK